MAATRMVASGEPVVIRLLPCSNDRVLRVCFVGSDALSVPMPSGKMP